MTISMEFKTTQSEIGGRHLYLYAKGAYERSHDNLIGDLRQVIAHTCGLDSESVTEEDIYRVCINTVLDYAFTAELSVNSRNWIHNLLVAIGKDHVCEDLYYKRGRSPRLAIIQECLGFLSTTIIRRQDGSLLVNIGYADPDVLPLAPDNSIAREATVAIATARAV